LRKLAACNSPLTTAPSIISQGSTQVGSIPFEGKRVLFGVTRSLVLEVASSVLAVDERPVTRGDLPAVDEAFVTSVSREVLPVVSIDGLPVGDGRVGRLTRGVMDGFAALVAREGEPL
jgi:branched-subunit amino acid aminotransferase/4-amino-4-deoxychorismate lyase